MSSVATETENVAPIMTPIRGAASSPELILSPYPDLLSPEHTDFRKELAEKGFAVIKNAIPRDRALQYQKKAFEWLQSFPGDLDFHNPDTWVSKNLPLTNSIGSYAYYCVAHEKFIWDARCEPGVLDAFSKLWDTEELLVSFDSLNITLPNRKDVARRPPWEHIDQSPLRRGVHCIQGLVNLSPSGPEDGGLVVLPGSHLYNAEFFDGKDDKNKSSWMPLKDVYIFNSEELKWFADRGVTPHKVCADVGDLIMWDSRVIHYGSEPTETSNQIRTVVYTTYTPRTLASEEQLALKKRAFETYSGTTHWPHQYIVPRANVVYLPDGTLDSRNRQQPLERPTHTDTVLRLAGIKDY